jgi:PhnB protein
MTVPSTVQTWLVSRDTRRLLGFITTVFGGEELACIRTEDGTVGHAEIQVGGTTLLAFDARPDWPATFSMLRVQVDDANATVDRALAAGAHLVTAPADAAWGDRTGRVRDPLGNIWWVVEHVEDVTPAEMATRLTEPRYQQAMADAQSTLDAELGRDGNGWSSPPILDPEGSPR